MFKKLDEYIKKKTEDKTFDTISKISKKNSMPVYEAQPQAQGSNEEE